MAFNSATARKSFIQLATSWSVALEGVGYLLNNRMGPAASDSSIALLGIGGRSLPLGKSSLILGYEVEPDVLADTVLDATVLGLVETLEALGEVNGVEDVVEDVVEEVVGTTLAAGTDMLADTRLDGITVSAFVEMLESSKEVVGAKDEVLGVLAEIVVKGSQMVDLTTLDPTRLDSRRPASRVLD